MHEIAQAEGVEQGDPLAPGFYALGQHDSLVAASASLQPTERLAAFLDDLYVVTGPDCAAPLLRVVTGEVERGAGADLLVAQDDIPPADILPYARAHDDAVWAVVQGLLGDQGPSEGDAWAAARSVAFLPPSLGGLSLLAAERVAPAAYWAAWADALAVLRQRYPDAADRLVRELEGAPSAPCLHAAVEAARQLTAEGWESRPNWESCARGADVPAAEGELGSEALVGSDMPFSHFTLASENARCFRPWLLPLEPSSTLNPVRMPVCS